MAKGDIARLAMHLEPHLEKGVIRRGSAMVPFEIGMVVSYRLSIVTIALSLGPKHSAAIYHRMSPTLKSTTVGHFGAKFGEEMVNRCKPLMLT